MEIHHQKFIKAHSIGCIIAPPAPLIGNNHNKLTPCFDWNYGDCTNSFNQGREYYQASQDQVSNGTVKMMAEPMSPSIASSACLNGQCTYSWPRGWGYPLLNTTLTRQLEGDYIRVYQQAP